MDKPKDRGFAALTKKIKTEIVVGYRDKQMSFAALREKYKIGYHSIRQVLTESGVEIRSSGVKAKVVRASTTKKVLKLRKDSKSYAEIAKECGLTIHKVKSIIDGAKQPA